MEKSQTLETMLDILRGLAPATEVTAQQAGDTLESLGFDSLDISSFLLAIEEQFGVKISDEELENLKTLNDYVAFVSKRRT